MPPRRWKIIACLFLVLATLAVYGEVRHHTFIHLDDDLYVTDNLTVKGGITWQGIIWAFTSTYAGFWHPLTWLSHMLDCQLFGLDAGGHHLTNLLLHLASTLFLKYVGQISLIILIFHGPIQDFWGRKIMTATGSTLLFVMGGFLMGVTGSVLIYELFIKANPVASFWFGRTAELPKQEGVN